MRVAFRQLRDRFLGQEPRRGRLRTSSLIASRADRDTLALTTLAAVANEYFQLLSLRERLDIARDNVDAARNLADIVASRYKRRVGQPFRGGRCSERHSQSPSCRFPNSSGSRRSRATRWPVF